MRKSAKLEGMIQSDMAPTSSATRTINIAKGRSRRPGERPAALMTISSLSLFSLFSVKRIAAKRAMGAMIITREGMMRLIAEKKMSID